jgi:hypothetical protein
MKNLASVDRRVILQAAAATATNSGVVDCIGADYVTIEVAVGTGLNTDAAAVVVKIQESDTNVSTNFADVSTTKVATVSITPSTSGPVMDSLNVNVGNGTFKRYLRAVATPGTVATNSAVLLTGIANVQLDINS